MDSLVVFVGLAQHELVVTAQEWVVEDGTRLQVDIRVGSFGLLSAGAVEVPPGQFGGALRHKVNGHRLRPEILAGAIDPAVGDECLALWLRQ